MVILIVDDDNNIRKAVSRVCEHEGFEVVLAEDANQAIKILQQNQVDILMTDNDMPGQKGVELIRTVQPQLPKLKIILMSGNCPDRIPYGVVFLSKPFNADDIINTIKETQ